MKKLLTLFTAFAISTSTGFSIISCAKPKEQKIIDNAVEKLEGKSFLITVNNGKLHTVQNAIKDHNDFKMIFNQLEVEIKSWQFKKDNYYIINDFKTDTEYDVILNIKKDNADKTVTKEGSINFKIKLVDSASLQTLQQAISKWEKIKNVVLNVEMKPIAWIDSEKATINEVISKFEQLVDYQTDFSNKTIVKEKIKLYKKNNMGEETRIINNDDLINNANIIIKVKLTCDNASKTLSFNIKLAKIIHQVDLRTISNDLQKEISKYNSVVNTNRRKTYSHLISFFNNLDMFKNKPLTDCEIKYYDQEIDGQEITNDKQQVGKVWFEIIANDKNKNWKGNTKRIELIFTKTDLNDIKTLTKDYSTSLKFETDHTKTYKDVNDQIVNAIEFKDKPLKSDYQIKYFAYKGVWKGYNEINPEDIQQPGTIYVEITAANDDSNWSNQTGKIAIEFIKSNLDTINGI